MGIANERVTPKPRVGTLRRMHDHKHPRWEALALSESHGESLYRIFALLSMGAAKWRWGNGDHAIRLLRQSLDLAQRVTDRRTAALLL
jgi:hypothetical protein